MLPPSKRKKVAEAERVETIDLDDDDVKEVNGDDDHKDKKSRLVLKYLNTGNCLGSHFSFLSGFDG